MTARGNERRRIFFSDADRRLFLQTLAEAVSIHGLRVHAYCLMGNHYHLAIGTPRGNLSRAVGWLQTTYTVRFNHRHRRSGHLFQGRFKAHVVEADGYAPVLVRYIHLNPVAGPRSQKGRPLPKEGWARLREFRWSSHRAYAGQEEAPAWLRLDWLGLFGRRRQEAHKEYRARIRAWFEEGEIELSSLVRGGLALGGEGFLAQLRERIQQRAGDEELRWLERYRSDDKTATAAKLASQEADQRLQVWLRVGWGGERGVDVARDFGWRDGSAVTQVIKRLQARRREDLALDQKMSAYERRLASSVKS